MVVSDAIPEQVIERRESLPGSTILIIGRRSDHFIAALRQALEDCGADVKVVSDSKRALVVLDRFSFTAVVLAVLGEGEDALLNRIVHLPTVFYGPETAVPEIVAAVVEVVGRRRAKGGRSCGA